MISVHAIQREIASSYGLPVTRMMSRSRARILSRPRQEAMWLSRKLTSHSLPKLGRLFQKDHSTILHACAAVEARRAKCAETASRLDALLERLQTSPEDFSWAVRFRMGLEASEAVASFLRLLGE